jgi:hypothetical protein
MRQIQQERERAVPCAKCHRKTWNPSAKCDGCEEKERDSDQNT